jgi:hypothetical protein
MSHGYKQSMVVSLHCTVVCGKDKGNIVYVLYYVPLYKTYEKMTVLLHEFLATE